MGDFGSGGLLRQAPITEGNYIRRAYSADIDGDGRFQLAVFDIRRHDILLAKCIGENEDCSKTDQ